jgi:hypothetical protein
VQCSAGITRPNCVFLFTYCGALADVSHPSEWHRVDLCNSDSLIDVNSQSFLFSQRC